MRLFSENTLAISRTGAGSSRLDGAAMLHTLLICLVACSAALRVPTTPVVHGRRAFASTAVAAAAASALGQPAVAERNVITKEEAAVRARARVALREVACESPRRRAPTLPLAHRR
jgi:hypothetical protein